MRERLAVSIVLAGIAAASAVTTLALYEPNRGGSAGVAPDAASWLTWDRLSDAERLEYTLHYQAIDARPDAAEVFRRARHFAELPVTEQRALRVVYEVVAQVLAELSAPQRHSLLALPERARAEAIYQLLEVQSPDTLRTLQDRVPGPG